MNDKITDEELAKLFGEIPHVEIDDEVNAIIAEFSGKKPAAAVQTKPVRKENIPQAAPAVARKKAVQEPPRQTAPTVARKKSVPEKSSKGVGKWIVAVLKVITTLAVSVVSVILTVSLLELVLLGTGVPSKSSADAPDRTIMDSYDMYMTNQVSNALDGVLAIEKVYWLNDHDLIAPEPNPNGFGKTTDPASLQWLLDEASELLGIEEFVFSTDIKTIPGSEINYYLDETIFAITWRESIKNCAYTFAEVKIAHPSQFRRFLAGGTYGSDKQFVTTQMASDVNAVLASSGDFYKFRNYGTIVYDGVVKRINSSQVDTCFIDDKGDLIFTYRGEITTMDAAQRFVDENNIRFSIAFGPVLIDNGIRCEPNSYPIGEINDPYARAGLGQIGELHYLVVTANRWQINNSTATIHDFAKVMQDKKCWKAYTLDGGQTGVIAMDGKMMNPAQYGAQRSISDIFYFATALPDGE